jgi:hypothetical protein
MKCTASVRASRDIPNVSGFPAAEGTMFHTIMSSCLDLGMSPRSFLGEVHKIDGFDVTVTSDMVADAQEALDEINEILPETYLLEKRVSLAPRLPDQFGTTDVAWMEGTTLHVWDWKYGREAVSPDHNPQLQLYALGVAGLFEDPPIETVKLHIYQPRGGGGGTWTMTYEQLLDFGDLAMEKGKEALSDSPVYTPGPDQCRYCPAKTTCAAFTENTLALLDFEYPDEFVPFEVTPERRSHILKNKKAILSWIETLEASTLNDALRGLPTPGYKAVLGREGNRTWRSEEDAAAALQKYFDENHVDAEPYEQVIISPAKVEEIVGKKKASFISELVDRSPAQPTLARKDDKRSAYLLSDKFEDVSHG